MYILPWAIGIGSQEMAVIILGVVLLFGAKRLPELARGMGEGMREFKKAMKEINEDDETPRAAPPDAAEEADTRLPR